MPFGQHQDTEISRDQDFRTSGFTAHACLGLFGIQSILVPRGRAPFGQHQESRPLAGSNNGSPRFTDFPSLCACSVSSLTNLIGSGLNLLCLEIHSKLECRWTQPEVAILGVDQKERILVPRAYDPSGLRQEPRALGATISGMRHR